ncbi:MAG: zinc-ribbon domain-containing protein [Clostridiales bacterium]|nr:zinc-ribbon domain-containing protein [Clostridiales bacterium]
MFCSNCGKELKDNVKYCSKCGHPITRQSSAIVEERTFLQNSHEKLWGSWVKWIVAGSLAILLIVAIIFLAVPKVNQKRYESLIKEGNRYLTEMNYEEAVIAFTKAIRIEEKEPDAYIGRGNAYTGLADKGGSGDGDQSTYQLAEADYKKALKLDKTLTDVYEKLSEVYLAQDKADKAEKILEQGYSATKNEKLSERLAEIQEQIQGNYGDGVVAESDDDPGTTDILEEDANTVASEDPARIAAYENVLNQYRTLCALPDDGTVDFLMDDSLYETEYPDVNSQMIFLLSCVSQ